MRFIDVIQAGDDVNYPKPNPEGICNVLLAWNFCAEDVLFVGDHSVDALAANSAKVRFIGVTTGTTSKIELMKYPHLAIADHLKDIL